METFRKPQGYDSVKAPGEFKSLPAGGYVCRIIDIKYGNSKSSGRPMLIVALDICDGEYTGYFMETFKNRKANASNPLEVKWPCVSYVTLYDADGNCSKSLKGFCTSLEDSGTQAWNDEEFNFTGVKGSMVGVLFGREEYIGRNDGKPHWSLKPKFFRSVETIESGKFTVPEDVPLSPQNNGYGGYGDLSGVDSFKAADDGIPF